MFKNIGALALGVLFIAAAVPGLKASDTDHAVTMSFSNAVEIPGRVLPAGTYVFRPIGENSRAVAIMNQDQTRTLGLESTIPIIADNTPDKPVVHLAERPGHNPEAVDSWFYPGDQTGYQFVYRPGATTGKTTGTTNASGF